MANKKVWIPHPRKTSSPYCVGYGHAFCIWVYCVLRIYIINSYMHGNFANSRQRAPEIHIGDSNPNSIQGRDRELIFIV